MKETPEKRRKWARYAVAYLDLSDDDGKHSGVAGRPINAEERYSNWLKAFKELVDAEKADGIAVPTNTPHGFFPSAAEAWEDHQRRLT